jgi:cytochrome c2
MPNLRLSDQEAADIGSYLLTLRNGDFERRSPAAADPRVRDDLALDFLKGRLPVREAEKQLAGMTDLERDLFVGERMISRQGCYGCHLVPGFEDAQPIGTELTEEGSKDVDKLDFALNPTNIPHTRYDWFLQKLKDPRVFDQGKVKSFSDKLRMPDFGLSDEDALSLTTALMSFSKSFVTPQARRQLKPHELEIEKGRKLVYEHNCKGCHILENEGGAVRAPLVRTYGNEGVAESEAVGFTPPVLNGEGRKVQPDWLFSFLKEVVPIRPWLDVRMPTFGFDDKGATDITTYFSRLDTQQFPYSTFEQKSLSPNDLRGAHVLFSQDVFNCWTCHQQGSVKPKGDPASWAPDLKMARERLKEDWIKAWLWDPQKIQPGTKMPTFFGDTTVYLPEEMAQYLRLPEGARPEGGVLQAPTDPVIQLIADYIIHGLHQGQQVTMR